MLSDLLCAEIGEFFLEIVTRLTTLLLLLIALLAVMAVSFISSYPVDVVLRPRSSQLALSYSPLNLYHFRFYNKLTVFFIPKGYFKKVIINYCF